MITEAREAKQQAQMDQGLLHCVAALERDKTTLQTKVSKANEALHKAWMLELQLSMEVRRESVLFIGTQFSNLCTAVDTPARGRVGVCVVFVCKYVLGHSRVSQPLNLWLCLLQHFGFLTSQHASPTCRRRRLTSYRLLHRSTPGTPPNLRAHLLPLPASPRPPLYTQTITI